MRRIFGREPALIASVLEGLVLLITAFGLDLTGEQIAGVNAVTSLVLAAYVAWGVYDKAAAALLQLLKAFLVLLAGFGVNVGPERTAALVGLSTALIAAFARTQVTAVVPPAPKPAVPGSVAVTDVGMTATEVALLVMAVGIAVIALVFAFGKP
jgi:hypothetical protein